MIGIVRIALQRPYTFVVLALLILIVGPLAALRMPTDIFPEIRIPVIAAAFQYTGLPPDQMAGRILTIYERVLTTTVNDVEHIEANSYAGFGIVKIFFHPGVDIATANAQVTAVSQTVLKQMPAGTTPPLILNYNASTVPILQVALAGKGLSEQNLADLGLNTIRTRLVTVPGAAIPYPFGGKTRQVQIDLDPGRAAGARAVRSGRGQCARRAEPDHAGRNAEDRRVRIHRAAQQRAVGHRRSRRPAGQGRQRRHRLHPRRGPGARRQRAADQYRARGRRALGAAVRAEERRHLDAGHRRRDQGQAGRDQAGPARQPRGRRSIGDQSLFVRAAIKGVAFEGVIAAALTSIMILLFLGSWRSTVIIAVSIPLSVLGAIAALAAFGETLNIMTLGGLALAVGILVDDATVTIENINWHLEHGKDVETSILDGAAQIVTPAFVSLLCICIVFVPMFFLEGVARFLFVPMAEAVMFAMICSFVLSRTLVPTMAKYLLRPHAAHTDVHGRTPRCRRRAIRWCASSAASRRVSSASAGAIATCSGWRSRTGACSCSASSRSSAPRSCWLPFLGRNFFPSVDGGQILMHARVPVGTRVEETANQFAAIQKAIRRIIPSEEIEVIVDNIGLSNSSINLTYNNTGVIGLQDGDIQVALKEGHRPTADYVRQLRERLPREFPGVTFSFPPADIVSQILNFGAPAPIDLQIRGANLDANFDYANVLLPKIRAIPGVADARIQQSRRQPIFDVDLDRSRAQIRRA
jgi:multidrug efflux pump subunit AcrB